MKKQLFFYLVLCLFVFIGCSNDSGDSEFSVANSEWVAKVDPWQISVPEEYRKDAYWILRFTDNEMTMSVEHNGHIMYYEFKGRYRFEEKTKILGLNANNGAVEYDLYLQENGTAIYFPYFGVKLIKQ